MSQRPDDDIAGLRIVKHRHWGRWFSALIVLLLLSLVVTSICLLYTSPSPRDS